MTPYDEAKAAGAPHYPVKCHYTCLHQDGFNEWMLKHILEPFMFTLERGSLYVNFINSQEAMLFKLRWANAA